MSTKLSQVAQAMPQNLFESSTTALLSLGERVATQDGRAYRYAYAGAVALVPGTLLQAPAEITNHENLAPAAAAIGATQVTVTLGATAVTANQYAGGYLMVTVTPGQGYQYLIASHPAAALSTTVVLTLSDPIQVALTTSSRCDLVANPYNGVVINPTTATSAPIGVAVYPLPINTYGWIQVSGAACVLADGTVTVGTNLVASNGTAGAVEATTGVQAGIGEALTGIATTEYGAVNLIIS